MRTIDWNRPQRQPIAGLAVVFANTVWEVLKRIWPLVIIMFLGKKSSGINRYEIIALVVLGGTIISAILRFIYFKFHLEEDKLIIRRGFLTKIINVIPLEKIQTVHIEQGPVHQALNIVKISIETAGSKTTEASIDALYRPMAETLREKLLSHRKLFTEPGEQEAPAAPLLTLGPPDLWKLSVSANHLEAFFIILTFAFGIYENLKDVVDESVTSGFLAQIPRSASTAVMFLIVAVLMITILVSTARIFFSFWNFRITPVAAGFQIRSGLTHVKERLVRFQRIQYISWKANWIRRMMKLWMLEYHVAGGDNMRERQKVRIPVTRPGFLPVLAAPYQAVPETADMPGLTIHKSFVMRRTLVLGLLPASVAIVTAWLLGAGGFSLLFLIYPFLVMMLSWLLYRKFRLWIYDDILFIKKGMFGEERILLQCYRIQSVRIRQSIYQRRKGLASLVLFTAGGNIPVHFIPLEAARTITNFLLYRAEDSNRPWM